MGIRVNNSFVELNINEKSNEILKTLSFDFTKEGVNPSLMVKFTPDNKPGK